MTIAERRAALLARVKAYGGPLNEPAVMAQFMAQVMHESGGLRFVREVWGATKAQVRYEGRADLGNTKPGDGKRFMGRDVLQITGRANYRALTEWVRKTFGAKVDFEARPELLESAEWLGIGAIWYFLTRKDLIRFCREGNIEMVTRRVNGGLNGYADRLRWYDEGALKLLGFTTVAAFQKSAGLVVDGISGPKTRAAMHQALTKVRAVDAPERSTNPVVVREGPVEAPQATPRPPVTAPPAAYVVAVVAAATAVWQWGADVVDWLTFWN